MTFIAINVINLDSKLPKTQKLIDKNIHNLASAQIPYFPTKKILKILVSEKG